MRRPPDAPPPPGSEPEAGERDDLAERRDQPYRHQPDRCFTCSGRQTRDTVADLWWTWGGPYREAVAA